MIDETIQCKLHTLADIIFLIKQKQQAILAEAKINRDGWTSSVANGNSRGLYMAIEVIQDYIDYLSEGAKVDRE